MQKLTRRQQEILDLIRDHIQETGYPPTRAEIAAHFGWKSPNAAEEHLKALARKGAIRMVAGASRGIQLPDQGQEGIPVVGRVAAGQPLLAEENVEDYCKVDPALFHPRADYFLRVRGESMKNIGILDGDLLAVHKTQEARNGQIVVARIENDVTVKRLERKESEVILWPENEAFEPIRVDLKREPFAIEGLAVGVIRPHA
ncbi:transcriptional repressor LexA [Hahella sp. SMD15-11]|uniref:LexA repressor n=1 Tax=Thermohahella caldifontis TaxID=3142973 RepID=A0AB39UYV4_9GAMM